MKFNPKTVMGIIVTIEIFALLLVGFRIYKQKMARKNLLGEAVFLPFSKENFVGSPSAGLQYFYEFEPNIYSECGAKWLPHKVVYTINSDTLNDRYDYAMEKPPNVYRIITLGDSFTFGQGVNTKDNWSERLEDELNNNINCPGIKKFEVINLGMPGYGVEYISHRYKTRGVKYNPDLLVWLESGGDFDRVNELFEVYRKEFEESMAEEEKTSAWQQGDFYPVWRRAMEKLYKNYTYEQLSEMVGISWQNFFEMHGSIPVLVATFSYLLPKQMNQLKLWTGKQQNVLLYDSLPNIYLKKWTLLDGHPNVQGHQIIAENIYRYLKNNFVIPCTP